MGADSNFVEAVVRVAGVGEGRAVVDAKLHGRAGGKRWARREALLLLLLLLLFLGAGFRGVEHGGLDDFFADFI